MTHGLIVTLAALGVAGQVLTRDQIADRAWELGAEHASNVVDVFVGTLRRKIDDPYLDKLLHTVRGVGSTLRVSDTAALGKGAPSREAR